MTTPTPAPSGAKASPSEEVIQLLYRWRTMDEPSLTPIQRECVLALAIDAHCAAHVAAKDRQIADLSDECFNERHEAKALRAMLDTAYADNSRKFHEGQSATDHGYVHVLAEKDATIVALRADAEGWRREAEAWRNWDAHAPYEPALSWQQERARQRLAEARSATDARVKAGGQDSNTGSST